ncbi:MAG: hypothetical protein GY793_09235, partial [Proteobacteria bacterium]|nr:hypothetical protein [Pseudomonadota bacterium]
KLEAYNLKLEGLKVGIADLVLILAGGTTIFIELKYDKNGQSVKQKEFEILVKELDFNYYVIKNIKDFKMIISFFINK